MISRPQDDELAALLTEHAHRYPTKAALTVRGDDGPVKLPMLLGNPSGACTMPEGVKGSPAWGDLVAFTLGMRSEPIDLAERLAYDCVLWPSRAVLAQWFERWPGLPRNVFDLVRQKVGLSDDCCREDPDSSEARLHVKANGVEEHTVELRTPGLAAWRLYKEAMRKPKADAWRLASDMVSATVKQCSPTPYASLAERAPGVVIVLIAYLATLVGGTQEQELGNW